MQNQNDIYRYASILKTLFKRYRQRKYPNYNGNDISKDRLNRAAAACLNASAYPMDWINALDAVYPHMAMANCIDSAKVIQKINEPNFISAENIAQRTMMHMVNLFMQHREAGYSVKEILKDPTLYFNDYFKYRICKMYNLDPSPYVEAANEFSYIRPEWVKVADELLAR